MKVTTVKTQLLILILFCLLEFEIDTGFIPSM